MRKNHIVYQDWGTHVVTHCGKFPRTVEEAMPGQGVCGTCRRKFLRTPEAIKKEHDELEAWGKALQLKLKGESRA